MTAHATAWTNLGQYEGGLYWFLKENTREEKVPLARLWGRIFVQFVEYIITHVDNVTIENACVPDMQKRPSSLAVLADIFRNLQNFNFLHVCYVHVIACFQAWLQPASPHTTSWCGTGGWVCWPAQRLQQSLLLWWFPLTLSLLKGCTPSLLTPDWLSYTKIGLINRLCTTYQEWPCPCLHNLWQENCKQRWRGGAPGRYLLQQI